MKLKNKILSATFVTALIFCGASLAQAPAGAPAPRPLPKADAAVAVAGTYTLDPSHTSIIARYLHQGLSYSTFRFGVADGELIWDPQAPSADKLTVSVETASVATPAKAVNGGSFAAEVAGDRFLKSAQFPKATFVSTKFTQLGPAKGKVDGNITLMGVTKPITFDVTLVGAGAGMRGPIIGVTGSALINGIDFGLPATQYGSMMFAGAPVELQIDVEFDKKT